MTERVAQIGQRLSAALAPTELEITDESHLHAGHAGARSGRGHYTVRIRAPAFNGKTAIQRHRLVYDALGEMMQTDIHALSIKALAPLE